jgi:hypothetical protein
MKYILENGQEITRFEFNEDDATDQSSDFEVEANFFDAIRDLIHSNENLLLRFHNKNGVVKATCR